MHNDDHDTICEEIDPLLAAYALGEEDAGARATIDAHVPGCARCRAALAAYGQLTQLLPLAAPEAAPAPDLRGRVIAAVDAAAAGRALAHQATDRAPRWLGRLGWLAAAVAILALLGWNLRLQGQLAAERAAGEAEAAAISALIQSPEAVRRPLSGAGGATGVLLVSADGRSGVVLVSGMPTLPPDRVYQLWLVADGKRTSGGTFRVDSAGRGALLVQPTQHWSAYDTVGVTAEPAGGSPGPTSPRVIGGPV